MLPWMMEKNWNEMSMMEMSPGWTSSTSLSRFETQRQYAANRKKWTVQLVAKDNCYDQTTQLFEVEDNSTGFLTKVPGLHLLVLK